MTLYVHDSGVWKLFSQLHVKSGGVWKAVNNAYVKDGGVWKQFFSLVSRSYRSGSVGSMNNLSTLAGVRTVTLVLNGDGTITATNIGSPGNWTSPIVAGIGAGYSARYTATVGGSTANFAGFAAGWNAIGSGGRAIQISNKVSSGESTGTMQVEISSDNSTALSTFTVDWDVGRSA